MADNTKTISVQFKIDQASFQQFSRTLQQFGNETKKMFDDINKSSGGLFSAGDRIKGTGSGGNSGGQTQKQQLNVGVGDAMIKSMDQLRAAMRGFSSDIKNALSTANSSVRDSVRSQTRDLDELERKYDKVAQKARSMGGGRSGGGGGDDLGSLVARYGGGYEPKGPNFGRGFYTRMAQLDEGYYGQTSGAVNQQFAGSEPGFRQGAVNYNTKTKMLLGVAGAVAIAGANDYIDSPFEDLNLRSKLGTVFGNRANEARYLTTNSANEIAAMERLSKDEQINQALKGKLWNGLATGKAAITGTGGVGIIRGIAGGAASLASQFQKSGVAKYLDENHGTGFYNPNAQDTTTTSAMLGAELFDSAVRKEVMTDPIGNAGRARAFEGGVGRISAMRALGIGSRFNKNTGTWDNNLMRYEDRLAAGGWDTGQAAAGFSAVEGAGGYGTAQRTHNLAMRAMIGGHIGGAGNILGAAAQMGMDPTSTLKTMIGSYGDAGAANKLGSYVAQRGLGSGTQFNMNAFAGALTANQPANMGSAGNQMFLAQGVVNAAQSQNSQLWGGDRDALEKARGLHYAFKAGATGTGAYLLANNPNVDVWAAAVARGGESAMPEELKRAGISAQTLLGYAGMKQGGQLRYGDRLAGAVDQNSALGKASRAAAAAGQSFDEYLKTIDPEEARKLKADRYQAEFAIEGKHPTRQDALGYGTIDVLNPRSVRGKGPRDPGAGSQEAEIEKQRAKAKEDDTKAAEKMGQKWIDEKFPEMRKLMEQTQHEEGASNPDKIPELFGKMAAAATMTTVSLHQMNIQIDLLTGKIKKMGTQ